MGDVIEMPGVKSPSGPQTGSPTRPALGATGRFAALPQPERDELIVRLKKAGCSFRQIGTVVDLGKSRVREIYRIVSGEQLDLDAVRIRRTMVVDLALAIEGLRGRVHDDETPASKDEMDQFIRLNKALAALLGLEEPKKSISVHDIGMAIDNPIAAEFVADLAVFIAETDAVSTSGNRKVALPPGMTEREVAAVSTNGNGHIPHTAVGHGLWSMVLEFPRDDDDPINPLVTG